jgi:hypothetical protein
MIEIFETCRADAFTRSVILHLDKEISWTYVERIADFSTIVQYRAYSDGLFDTKVLDYLL